MKKTLSMISLAAVMTAAEMIPLAAQDFPSMAPIPYARPDRSALPPSLEVTGAISQPIANPASSTVLKQGLDALKDSNVPGAMQARARLPDNSLDHQILSWAIAVSGEPGVPSSEIAEAQQELRGWPGLSSLRANSERAFARENPSPNTVLAAFGNTLPETSQGTILLARAYLATGQKQKAHDIVNRAWTGWALDTSSENQILKEFGSILSQTESQEPDDLPDVSRPRDPSQAVLRNGQCPVLLQRLGRRHSPAGQCRQPDQCRALVLAQRSGLPLYPDPQCPSEQPV